MKARFSLLLCASLALVVSARGFSPRSPLVATKRGRNSSLFSLHQLRANTGILLNPRGGGRGGDAAVQRTRRRQASSVEQDGDASLSQRTKMTKIALWTVATVGLSYGIYYNRVALAACFNKEAIQERTLSLLNSVNQDWKGLALYGTGMAVWELLGLSTIPVETAAGMAFGFWHGWAASAMGKLVGAFAGYILGRTLLQSWVRTKLENNNILKLMDGSVSSHPFRVAMLMRYSCFPEFVKNCGASLFEEIKPWMFCLSIILHGWIFSACWTYVGMDTARHLAHTAVKSQDIIAKIAVLYATIVGMVLTPLLMAWWIRDMQKSQLNVVDPDAK